MKAALLCLLLCGCASTRIYDAHTGHLVFSTQADATNISYGSFHADTLNHSHPTRAGGSVAGTVLSGVVPAIMAAKGFVP